MAAKEVEDLKAASISSDKRNNKVLSQLTEQIGLELLSVKTREAKHLETVDSIMEQSKTDAKRFAQVATGQQQQESQLNDLGKRIDEMAAQVGAQQTCQLQRAEAFAREARAVNERLATAQLMAQTGLAELQEKVQGLRESLVATSTQAEVSQLELNLHHSLASKRELGDLRKLLEDRIKRMPTGGSIEPLGPNSSSGDGGLVAAEWRVRMEHGLEQRSREAAAGLDALRRELAESEQRAQDAVKAAHNLISGEIREKVDPLIQGLSWDVQLAAVADPLQRRSTELGQEQRRLGEGFERLERELRLGEDARRELALQLSEQKTSIALIERAASATAEGQRALLDTRIQEVMQVDETGRTGLAAKLRGELEALDIRLTNELGNLWTRAEQARKSLEREMRLAGERASEREGAERRSSENAMDLRLRGLETMSDGRFSRMRGALQDRIEAQEQAFARLLVDAPWSSGGGGGGGHSSGVGSRVAAAEDAVNTEKMQKLEAGLIKCDNAVVVLDDKHGRRLNGGERRVSEIEQRLGALEATSSPYSLNQREQQRQTTAELKRVSEQVQGVSKAQAALATRVSSLLTEQLSQYTEQATAARTTVEKRLSAVEEKLVAVGAELAQGLRQMEETGRSWSTLWQQSASSVEDRFSALRQEISRGEKAGQLATRELRRELAEVATLVTPEGVPPSK